MDIYFYCSYEHSRTGFFMTKLEREALIPAVRPGHTPPEAVRSFFSYDRFLLLWRDLCGQEPLPRRGIQISGSFFGLRSLTGVMSDGRSGVINLAFLAQPGEDAAALRRAALTILGDYDRFVRELFSMLRAGGDCGYELDTAAFGRWLDICRSARTLRPVCPRGKKALELLPRAVSREMPKRQTDLLHLAVCACLWEEVRGTLGDSLLWHFKPRCVLTPDQFSNTFQGGGALWELTRSGG